MKSLIKAASLVLIFAFLLGGARSLGTGVLKKDAVYLLLGLDDSAENTDSIILLSYNGEEDSVAIIQIPRDSYANYGSLNKKINGAYPYYKASGLSQNDALSKTADLISTQFGTRIDGAVAITTAAFRACVDALGGVRINLPKKIEILGSDGNLRLSLNAGENILYGADAELFVRHRKSFATGDLGRIENQRAFLKGFIRSVFDDFSVEKITRIYRAMGEGLISDLSLLDIAFLATKYSKGIINSEIPFLTMPGKAQKDEFGIWYYIPDRNGVENLVSEWLIPI